MLTTSDTDFEVVDDDDYGVRWWDDLELKGKKASDEKALTQLNERLLRLYEYCEQDVESERLAEKRLYPLSDYERQVYLLDQKINDRGISVDLETTHKAIALIEQSNIALNRRVSALTGGEVTAVTQRDRVVNWLQAHGCPIASLNKQTVESLLSSSDISPEAREMLELRQTGSKSSVRKLMAILAMADDKGRIRGNILYHAASTGRFAGKGVQMQNLPRPSLPHPEEAIPYIQRNAFDEIELCFGPVQNVISDCIRSLIIVEAGKVFYAADFAAIEARVLAWIAGQDDLVAQFANNDDVYLSFASEIYRKPLNKKEHTFERQLGKTCIAEGTLVYTNKGLVPIEHISKDMLVWDGQEWTGHSGSVLQGTKQTLNLCGISLTPDHLVLCGEDWQQAQSLVQDEDTLRLALVTAVENFVSPDMSQAKEAELPLLLSGAIVDQTNTLLIKNALETLPAQDAISALKSNVAKQEKDIGVTRKYVQMTSTGSAYSIESAPLSNDALIPTTTAITTTEGAVLSSTPNGSLIDGNFLRISFPLMGGISPLLSWTGSTITKDTYPTILDLYRAKRTSIIEDRLERCSNESLNLKRVYDITNAGPRHRFTIHTDRGPLIVHNCVLGLGFMMGAPKFKLSCEKVGINLSSDEEYVRIVKLYRSKYKKISSFWYNFEKIIIRAVNNPDKVFTFKHFKMRMRDGNLRVQLPSGRVLNYPEAKIVQIATPWGAMKSSLEISADSAFTRKWERQVLSPGLLTENVVQAIARDLMVAAMFRVEEAGYPVVLTVHDELISEVDSSFGTVHEYETLVAETPSWAAGLPVKAEGWSGERYRK